MPLILMIDQELNKCSHIHKDNRDDNIYFLNEEHLHGWHRFPHKKLHKAAQI